MSARIETRLWLAQRAGAAVLAVCVVVHLGTMIVAVQGGLSAAEIMGRVAGNGAWAAFYGVFVLAVAAHAPIGLRAVLNEMTRLSRGRVDLLATVFALFLFVSGMRTVLGFFLLGRGG